MRLTTIAGETPGGACWYKAPQYRKRLTGRIYSVDQPRLPIVL